MVTTTDLQVSEFLSAKTATSTVLERVRGVDDASTLASDVPSYLLQWVQTSTLHSVAPTVSQRLRAACATR